MINQLVSLVSERLGVPTGVAEQAVGVVLGLLKDKANGQAALGRLFDAVPGAEALADQFPAEAPASGGGLMGGLLGKAADLMGGNAGDMADAFAAFQKTGLSMDQAQEMLPVAKDFMTEQVGEETVGELMDLVPVLKNLLP